MEDKLKYIPLELNHWIRELLLSEKANFYLLHSLKDKNILGDTAEITHIEKVYYRSSALKNSQGYLTFKTRDNEEVRKEFISIVFDAIENKNYTIEGLLNLLILIDRLGSLYDEQQYNMTLQVIDKIPKVEHPLLTNAFVELFNKDYNFSNSEKKTPLTCQDWDDLFFSIQYIDRLSNPIDLLRRTLKKMLIGMERLSCLSKLKPDPRSALLEYGFELDNITEEDVIRFLKQNPHEITFIAAYILDEFNKKPAFVGQNLARYLIEEHWLTVGKYFFRKAISKSRGAVNEETKNILINVLDSYFKKQFSSPAERYVVFDSFSWPDDYLALGGWLLYINRNGKPDFEFDNKFYEELTVVFSQTLNKISDEISFSFSDSQKSHNIWLSDIFDARSQYVLAYLQGSILVCSQSNFDLFHKQFKNLCFQIKELYYGSYQANHLAQKLSNNLLGLIFSYPGVDKEKTGRAKELLHTFSELILYSWVVYSERDKTIWLKTEETDYVGAELRFVIARLKKPPESYQELISYFKSKIAEYSTVKWPI